MYTSDTTLNCLTSIQPLKIATVQSSLVFYKLQHLKKKLHFYHFSGPKMAPVYLPPYKFCVFNLLVKDCKKL